MRKQVERVVAEMVHPYLDENQYELVDVEYIKEGSNWFLRVYVDCEGGIDVEQCGLISQYISAKLDETDPIEGAYFLEVSSPGAERPLKKPADFHNSIGAHVLITTYQPFNGLKEFEGTLTSYNDEFTSVEIGKITHQIPQQQIANARLAIKF